VSEKSAYPTQDTDELSSDQADLLDLLLERQLGTANALQEMQPQPRPIEGTLRLPASWAQQRLWFFEQLQGGSAAYNIPLALRLQGRLNLSALRGALDRVVQRHEVLRTIFVSVEGEPQQQIAREAGFDLALVDLSSCAQDERAAELQRHVEHEVQGPFDLTVGPLIRGRLLRLHSEDQLLLITMHHIVSDGWSAGVLMSEIAELYGAFDGDRPDPLQPLRVQYADYAVWQRGWLQGEVLQKQLACMCARLAGARMQLDLPTDRPRPAVQSYRGASAPLVLNAGLTGRLRDLAERHGMTLFMVLHAGWSLLLSRLSGQEDIVVGTPIANRRRPELEGLIGFFVNMLALRAQARGTMSLREFLQHVKEVTLEAYDHQDLPFEQLVESLRPERSLSRHPVFQTVFVLQNAPQSRLQFADLSVTAEPVSNRAAKFDLSLELEERDGRLCGHAIYASDLFDRATIERWLASFAILLQGMTIDDDAPTDDLPLLSAEERHRVVELFNATDAPYPRDQLTHELFEEQVRRDPHALAAVYRSDVLTYAELNRRANRLAHFLRSQGVGPDRLVGLCLERGMQVPIALLGVLKAGGAYVPLDPNYPRERLAYMLTDAEPVVLLTQEHLRDRLPAAQCPIMALDSDWTAIAQHSSENLDARTIGLTVEHLANVIYTSGSTGQPKGVMVPHRGICNLAVTQLPTLRITSDSRILQFASLSFDASTWEWTSALCSGACLCLADREDLAPGEPLHATLRALQITHAILAPVAVGALPSVEGLDAVGTMLVGGEACPAALVQRWAHGRRFINGYGPTEASVCASLHICDEHERGNPPIGRPISNVRTYILDARQRPVPIGVTGELYIGGVGVARGYLHRPQLTDERFVADPFAAEARSRLYRTGDLARWRAEGTIEYLGRNDDQVKIRGLRIELGEIQAQLALHPQVRECVVVAREDIAGDKRLVAYVVAADLQMVPKVEELRDRLKAVLPDYMVPSGFVMLDRLPMTLNGKLDRQALPAPELAAYVTRTHEAPQGDVEEIVAGIWQSLLRVEQVGRRDNFFELGGHSLLIVQMLERLRRLGFSAAVRVVFDSPTLADLARALQPRSGEQFEPPPNLIPPGCASITPDMLSLVELQQRDIDVIVQTVAGGAANVQDIYPLAPLQEGILFHHLMNEGEGDTYVLPLIFEVSCRTRLDRLIAALQAAIDRHDVLRTAVLWEQLPRPVQIVYRSATLPVSEIALDPAGDCRKQLEQWIRPERQRLDIRKAPLMRLQVAPDPRGAGHWYALLQLHHMTIDHVALQIVTSDVVAHLAGREQIRPASAPYRTHVAQALAYAREHDAKAFFRNKLGDIEAPTAPFGLLDVHGDGSRIGEARETLDATLATRVRERARREGVSAATLFHAAWALVIAHTSGRDDVVFGSVLLGRLQGSAGAQRTLGMFINTLPLRLRMHDLNARQLVERTQRELVELLGHEQASLADAQRCSGIVGAAPLFSALLNFRHSVPDPQGAWSSAAGIRVLAGEERTNYPITLSIDDLGTGFQLAALVDRQIGGQRMIGYLRTAISSLIDALDAAPHTPALLLQIVPVSEWGDMVHAFNATAVSYNEELLVHELFEAQVRRTPNVAAVAYQGHSLSYSEVNASANQLARHLRAEGIGPGSLVGLCVERSIEMVVGVLAVLKAGGAYVPLDPSYPPERLQYMLADAAPRVVLTQRSLQSVLPASSARAIALDEVLPKLATDGSDDLHAAAMGLTSRHPVYVIYTSGSTGQPKGTVMPHRAMVNLLEWHRSHPRLGRPCKVLQFAALSFDVAFQETFSTLCTGGTLVLLDEWVRKDARPLLDLLATEGMQRLFVPPLMLQSLAECFDAQQAPPLQLDDVIVAGEQLRISPQIVQLFRHLRDCQLHNHYGPTETHVVTASTLLGEPAEWPTLPTIGTPIANTQVYLLDSRRQPVPLGVSGEIHIAGANVADSYLQRPELTAQRFILDPFNSKPGARMYRTGDVARWRADGSIEYLGRNDDQVKIRGYRIELGEIEARLARHSKVREAAVMAREDAAGERRLVAYVTCHDHSTVNADELRAHLKSQLPEHMIPGAFVTLPAMPLTPSGKLNRRALPAPDGAAYASRRYEPPQGAREEQLTAIWQAVLGVERIGRHDDFFELGGHSLLALKAILRMNQLCLGALRVTDIYKCPTVAQLAARLLGDTFEDSFVDPKREVVLDAALAARPGPRRVRDKFILLTGSTGFVGRFLLAQLLQETDATIYCHVRAQSRRHAAARLQATLTNWDLWDGDFSRIVAIAGDLRLPRLGVAETVYRDLARDVDSIYHCATSMNHLETYATARVANVDSVAQFLELATCERPKLINYISTLGVFGATAGEPTRTIDETSPLDGERYLQSQGYLASKWVAERIFMTAMGRGVPCNIFRLGLVWADSQQGRFDERQSVYRIIKSCLLSGYGIENYRYPMPPTPVDYVAQAVVHLAGRHREGGGIFHVGSSGHGVEGVFERCNEIAGTDLELVPFYTWIRELQRLREAGYVLPAVPLLEYAFSMSREEFLQQQRSTRSAVNIRFDLSRTHRELEEGGIWAPVLNDDLLKLCLDTMIARDPDLQGDPPSLRLAPAGHARVGEATLRH
jgi:amino acid adenylation domain-containing protein/thioester reductase-like protein